MEKRNTNRTLVLFLIFVILMVLLTIRVYYIQIICHEELTEAAQSQYEVLVAGIDNRGQILDRNHMPLTGGLNQYYYFVEKDFADENLDFLMKSIDAEQIASTESSYLVYRAERYDKEVSDRAKDDYKAYVLECPTRYGEEQIACHLIGYLNEDEQKGVSGIELLCEEKLSKKQGALTLWADAAGYLISGTEPARGEAPNDKNTSLESEVGVVTTIDRRIQFATERFLQNQTTSGAAIVMDADTGEILAWTAMPTFNPNNIEDYLYSGSDCLINKVSQSAYPPGSVFKIVTALAGLEDGIDPALEFECEGKTEVEGIEVSCIVEEGHGKVDMREAMAVSCNCYFAKLCESVGYEKVIEAAGRMGFGQTTMECFPEEVDGNLPKAEQLGPWDTSNISIGQGQLLATPIQVCQMTAVIANGGYIIQPKILQEESTKKIRVIDHDDAQQIEGFLKAVMTEGTAQNDWEYDVYGKTGTSENGALEENSNVCWFTGYFRQDERNYAITVMIEEGMSGTNDALPVFKNIVQFLGEL